MAGIEYILIPIAVFIAVVALGGAILAPGMARKQALRPRLFESGIADPLGGHSAEPTAAAVALGRLGSAVSGGKTSPGLRQNLARAGFHSALSAEVFVGAKVLLFTVGSLAVAAFVVPTEMTLASKVVAVFGAGGLLSFVPNFVVSARRSARASEVRTYLPDATDLLEICVSSGMGLDQAWNAVTDEIRRVSTVLADEMALTNLEIQLGAPRATALRHMAMRTGADELGNLVAVLVQSDRFGTSVSDALKQFATAMRETRSQRAEEKAEKMAVKLIVPMVLFIFPAMLIVMVGPALIRLFPIMGGR